MRAGDWKVETVVDQSTWPRAGLYAHFRKFDRPHYATTVRLDVSGLMQAKAKGASVYRGCLYAIGAGLHAVPELRMRFRDDLVVFHDAIMLSMTVPTGEGSFNFAYVPYAPEFETFDAQAKRLIAQAADAALEPDQAGDAVAYMSCQPWLDYTSINNAMQGPDDCIPRVSWGKIVPKGKGHEVAMTLEVHHALVDGAHVGAYFAAVQAALDGF